MRRISVALVAALTAVSIYACKQNDGAQPTPTTPPAGGYPPGAYAPQPGQPGYAQPGYPPPGTPGAYPTATAAAPGYAPPPGYPTAPPPGGTATPPPPPAGSGALSTPGPLAGPCQNDAVCITHKCNTQYGKCAFPCTSDNDCIQGSACQTQLGTCIPKPPGQ